MRKFDIAKRVGAALLRLLAVGSLAAALASATLISSAHAQSASSGPRTWHVLVGGQSKDRAIQAEGYYPRVITIDAGDTVVWTLNTGEIHSVTFAGTCEDLSCVPECVFTVNVDVSPCGPTSYDGVSAIASSGRMVPGGYNWNDAVPHGDTTYALTFTNPGVNVYFDLSVSGMRGVVIVHPAGTPYPFTQAQYAQQAQNQVLLDLAAGARARDNFQPVATSTNPDGTQLHHVALGTSPPERASVDLRSGKGSNAEGRARLEGIGVGILADANDCRQNCPLRSAARQRACGANAPGCLRSASAHDRLTLHLDLRPPHLHARLRHCWTRWEWDEYHHPH